MLRLLRVPVIAERRKLAGRGDSRLFDFGKHLRFAGLRFDEWRDQRRDRGAKRVELKGGQKVCAVNRHLLWRT